MTTINIPKSDYIPHPEGRYTGCIVSVEDMGEVETSFGPKLKLAVRLECDSKKMDNGQPYSVSQWYTVSSHPKSNLTKLREMLLGRKLGYDEMSAVNPAVELIGKRVGYLIAHREVREGGTFAAIDNIWPVVEEPLPSAPASDDPDSDLPF
jgi:hypothetical protein